VTPLRENGCVSARPELRQDAETLFRAVAAVADAFYVVDPTGQIAFVNPASLQILGYTREEELLGRPSHETIHYRRRDGSPYPQEECPLLRPLLTGETVRIDQDSFVRRDGSSVDVAYSSAPVDLVSGRGAVVAFRDISDRLRLGDVEASGARIARAADDARRTIERDLHDGAQQQFVAVAMRLEDARRRLKSEPAQAARLVEAAVVDLHDAIEELRRIAHGMHPAELPERGLEGALRTLARRSATPVDVKVGDLGRLPPAVEAAAYFVAAEATANAVKHGNAKQVDLALVTTRDALRLTITDDGVGGAAFGYGTGLQGLRDRAIAIGGDLTLESPAGGPTVITAELPLRASSSTASDARVALKVVLADDAVLIREALGELLARAGIEVAAEAGDASSLLRAVEEHEPEVAIVDIHMPPTQTREGIGAALEIRNRYPGVGVLLLSTHIEVKEAVELFSATASSVGYLLKDSVSNLDELIDALTRINEGGTVLDPKLVVDLLRRTRQTNPLDVLTPRERDVVGLMAEGRSNAGIAKALWVTEGAVEKHIKHIFNKLGIPPAPDSHRRVLAVITFLDAR
jgi:PAS domain S-box-containing protein